MRRTLIPRILIVLAGGGLAALLLLVGTVEEAESLPQYAARSGRTCDNCHTDPTDWENPSYFERQCTLSCSVCHFDPTGGGMRTVAGQYFGIQTLPALGATRRPWGDDSLFYFTAQTWDEYVEEQGEEGTEEPSSQPTSQPSDGDDSDSDGYENLGIAAFGTPFGGSDTFAWDQERYGGLNADPMLAIGADIRGAFFFNNETVAIFPMQLDIGVMFRPVSHVALVIETGGQGARGGLGETVAGDEYETMGLHEAFIMTDQWPGNAYLKAGRFVPPFGTRLDDHTAYIRRPLGFDQGRPSSFVSGVEIGAAPNYPYLNAAFFQLDAGQFDFFPQDTGTGFSAMTGWRDLAWGIGGSVYSSSHDTEGERLMGGANWHLNPWRLHRRVPLTYLGEVDFVHLTPLDGRTIQQIVAFHELDFAVMAGWNLRFRYDYKDLDLDVQDDHAHRLSIQADLFPVRFTEIQLVFRTLFPALGEVDTDFLMMLRGYY